MKYRTIKIEFLKIHKLGGEPEVNHSMLFEASTMNDKEVVEFAKNEMRENSEIVQYRIWQLMIN